MKKRQTGMLFIALTVLASTSLHAQTDMSVAARDYLNRALDILQQNSINKKKVNWTELRSDVFTRAAGAQNPEDTYSAIRFALLSLDDRHSFLQLSDTLRAKEKESRQRREASLPHPAATQAVVTQSEKWPPSPYIDRREPTGDIVRANGLRLGRLVVPLFEGQDDASTRRYAAALQSAVVRLAKQNPAGWIIDLRGNLGGNMWPMLAGVGALEGFGRVGGIIDSDGHRQDWFVSPKGVGMTDAIGERKLIMTISQPRIANATRPVAVIFDHGTASSGEAIAVSFHGRRLSHSFGRPTHGQTTANQGFQLPDGANIVLATGLEEDRRDHVYPDGLVPDTELPEETNLPPVGSLDPMTKAAIAWIQQARRHQN